MKSVQILSPSNNGRHLFFVIVQAQGSVRLLFFVTVSLFLSSHSLGEATCSLLIGRRDVRRRTTCMFSGTPPPLIDSQRVSPRPFAGGPFLRDFVCCRERTSSPSNIRLTLKPQKPALHHHSSPSSEEKHFVTNQLDSRESARLTRISQTHSNQPDSPSRFQPRNLADPRPRLPSIEPSPSTATHSLGSRPCRLIRHQGTSRAHSGLWASDRAGPRPFIDCSLDVLCPFVGLLVYGHRPFSLCPRGLFVYVADAYGPYLLRLRALAFI